MARKKQPNQPSIYEMLKSLREPVDVDIERVDRALGELAFTSYWKVLKNQVIEKKIQALLAQADDIAAVMEGKLTVEEFGVKCLVARIAAGHLQDIIDKIEATGEWLEKEKEKERKGKEVRRRG